MSIFLIVSLVCYFAIPPYFPDFIYEISKKEGSPVFSYDKKVFSYKTWQKGDRRVIISDPEYPKILNAAAFLGRYLEKDQTFIDLSNSPLLYFFANRRHPAFIYENVYYASETLQKPLVKNLRTDLKNNQLPLVVFKQNSLLDFLDFFPNEMRSYRVAEFIYNNYSPFLKIENSEIWVSNKFDASNMIKEMSGKNAIAGSDRPKMIMINPDAYTQEFNLRMLPYIWGTYDETGAVHNLTALFNFNKNIPYRITPDTPFVAHFDAEVDKSKGNYLHLSMRTEKPAKVKISYGKTSENLIGFSLKPTGRTENYLIRISSQWAWVYQPVSSLTITSSAPAILQRARILEGD